MVQWTQLETLYDVTQGVSLSRVRSEKGPLVRVVQVRNLDSLEVSNDIDVEKLKKSFRDHLLKKGDILVSLRGIPIRASVVTADQTDCVASSNIAVASPKAPVTPPADAVPEGAFLAGLLRSAYMNRVISATIGGKTMPSLSVSTLRELEIPVFSAEDKKAFAEAFNALSQYTVLARELIELHAQRVEVALLSRLETKRG